jgi:excisionase family DNA binding protein
MLCWVTGRQGWVVTPALRSPLTPLLTISEAASRLGLSTSAVLMLIRDGVFEKLRVSVDGWRLRSTDLDAYALSRTGNATRPAVVSVGAKSTATARGATGAARRATSPGRPGLLAVRRLGVAPPAARWPRFGGPAASAPAAFLAFPDTAHALEYLRTCERLANPGDARTAVESRLGASSPG